MEKIIGFDLRVGDLVTDVTDNMDRCVFEPTWKPFLVTKKKTLINEDSGEVYYDVTGLTAKTSHSYHVYGGDVMSVFRQ